MSAKAHFLTYQCVFWLERARAGSINAGRESFWLAECRRVAAELIGAGA
jgi:hypothetical protein